MQSPYMYVEITLVVNGEEIGIEEVPLGGSLALRDPTTGDTLAVLVTGINISSVERSADYDDDDEDDDGFDFGPHITLSA